MPPSAPESSSSRQSDTVVESGDDIRIPLTISPADEHNTIESAPSPRTALAASLYARTERLVCFFLNAVTSVHAKQYSKLDY